MGRTTELKPVSTAEAFYRIFRVLSKKDKIAVVRYIMEDEEVRKTLEFTEIPNALTLEAFAEDKSDMPAFETIDELRKDLLS